METYTKKLASSEAPAESLYYFTDKGFLKYDYTTKSFYDENNSPIKVMYWLKKNESFKEVVRPCIHFLATNHHPHTIININCTNAQIYKGVKSTGQILDYLID